MHFIFPPALQSSFFLIIFLSACASPKAPTGGPKDEAPPSIIREESTPNQQVLFTEKEIIITFDEWVTLKDVYKQLVISPLMPKDPDIKQKGKAIIITLPDSLREETTYTVNFGNAIADLNEGNILENFAFVFSTGEVLDSSKLSGTITDAVSLKPAEGIWVMLHHVGVDSAVYKRKPEYVAKTNKDGKWSISNIRADSFMVVALKDDNLNFLYDQETELFGWLEEPVVTKEAISIVPVFSVFPREKSVAIREVTHAVPGWIKIIVESPLPKPAPVLLPEIENASSTWNGDTLYVWYSPEMNYSGYAVLNGDSTQIRVSPGTSTRDLPLHIVPLTGRLYPQASALYSTELPIASIDTSKIILTHDSLGTIPFTISTDSLSMRRISLMAPWLAQSRYLLTFLPGAILDFWGRTNDTIRNSILVSDLDQFGDLTIKADGLDSAKQYVVLVKSGVQIIERFVIEKLKATQLKRNGLTPGKYSIEIFQDDNRNGIWDTGSYHALRQPERKMIFILENLRAGWEQESLVNWQ